MTITNSKEIVYTENFTDTVTEVHTPIIKRAINVSGSKAESISVSFDLNDPLLFNGYIWFYDIEGSYVGVAGFFRDVETGIISSMINNGSAIYRDGSTNTVIVQPDDIRYSTGKTYDQISFCHIILTDGEQYPEFTGYDCRSISPKIVF